MEDLVISGLHSPGFWGFLLSFLEIFHEILARIAGILGLESRRLSRRNGFQIFELTFSGKNVFWLRDS